MKNIFYLLLVPAFFAEKTQAQLFIQPGATLTATGSAQITVNKTNFTNNGTFTAGGSTVIMKESGGAADLLIGGSSPTTFHNLTLDLTSRDLRLMQHIAVGNNVTFTNGDLDLNGFDCDLGSTGNISGEAEGRRFYGTSGEVIRTAVLNAPNAANPGNLGILITSPEDLGMTTLRRGHAAQPTGAMTGIKRYFGLSPANNTGLNATLRLLYFDGELNGNDEAGLELWKDEGAGYSLQGFTSRDASANFVELTGIASLSSWTLGGNGCATSTVTCYFDGDGDGFGAASAQTFCDVCPANYVEQNNDCNDSDPLINPNGTEVCNGVDDDCDTQMDEGLTFLNYYFDGDGDGFGAGSAVNACQSPGANYVLQNGDCNDGNPAIKPSATEVCNGTDDDCDTQIDEGLTFQNWYLDGDGDSYGAGSAVNACSSPGSNYVLQNGDCNDGNSAIHPNATEICNGVDDDCDSMTDEGFPDFDGDGMANCVDPDDDNDGDPDATDCNDFNPAVHHNATEICNGIDDDCDGLTDSADPDYMDNTPPTAVCQNVTVSLNAGGQASVTAAQVNNGSTDNCAITSMSLSPSSFNCSNIGANTVTLTVADGAGNTATCTAIVTVHDVTPPNVVCQNVSISLNASGNYTLTPGQVYQSGSDNCGTANLISVMPNTFDCSDIGPKTVTLTVNDGNGNTATCSATVTIAQFVIITNVAVTNETCAGASDGSIAITATTLGGTLVYSIDGGSSFSASNTFTNLSAGVYSIVVLAQGTTGCMATGSATVGAGPAGQTWYKDLDNDGYSDGVTQVSCTQPAGYKLLADLTAPPTGSNIDCDDNDPLEHPGQTWYKDTDNDGYSNGTTLVQCSRPTGYKVASELTQTSGDCNDSNANIHPNATEVCNGVDDDCDTQVDEGLSGITYVGNVTFTTQAQVNAWPPCFSKIQGNLMIQNSSINNLGPLMNLTWVTGNVTIKLTSLPNLNGLNNLATVGGFLSIFSNNSGAKLSSLDGLQGLMTVGGNLSVYFNFSLTDCCAIYELVNEIPPHNVGGSISIHHNDSGCDSVPEINTACAPAPPLIVPPGSGEWQEADAETVQQVSLFPNPATRQVSLLVQQSFTTGSVRLYDLGGRLLLERPLLPDECKALVNLEEFRSGIYLVIVQLDGERFTEKLMVE